MVVKSIRNPIRHSHIPPRPTTFQSPSVFQPMLYSSIHNSKLGIFQVYQLLHNHKANGPRLHPPNGCLLSLNKNRWHETYWAYHHFASRKRNYEMHKTDNIQLALYPDQRRICQPAGLFESATNYVQFGCVCEPANDLRHIIRLSASKERIRSELRHLDKAGARSAHTHSRTTTFRYRFF
jgi:hypothetical protein